MNAFKSLASGPLSVFMSGLGTFASTFFGTSGPYHGTESAQITFICGKT